MMLGTIKHQYINMSQTAMVSKIAGVSTLILLLFLSVSEMKSQNKDTLFCKAKILKIDTINYYIVIKAVVNKDKEKLTILSPLYKRSDFIVKCKDSTKIKIGRSYNFALQRTSNIKNGEGENDNLLIPLKNFYYGKVHLLDDGEFPFVALNMYKFEVYCSCKR